ncbi:MAG: XRE family transcriptional regulator [Bacteroidales bacterium]|nr:XRE family transcriptional regulator [Bacteroidales bacterium]
MHIGKHIKYIVRQKGVSVSWLADKIPCDRTNIYFIYKRSAIDTDLLQKLSKILNHDFFKDLSEETFSENN